MSGIYDLTEQSTVTSSDQIPVYSTTNGQPRRFSVQALLTYVAQNLSSVVGPLPLKSYLLAELPSAALYPYSMVYCFNGNAGAKCVAVSDGTNWKVVALGATVS